MEKMMRMKKKTNLKSETLLGSISKRFTTTIKAVQDSGFFRRPGRSTPSLVSSLAVAPPLKPDSAIVSENYERNAQYYLTDPLLLGVVDLRATLIHMAGYDIICNNGENDEILVEELKLFLERIDWNEYQDRTCVNLDIYGNSFYFIARDEDGSPAQLIPVPIEKIDILVDENTNEPYLFKFRKPLSSFKGQMQFEILECEPKDMLFFRTKRVGESVYGYSKIYSLRGVLEARSTIFQLMPEIIRSQVFPWMQVTINENIVGARYEKIKQELESVLENAKNDKQVQYIITPDAVKFETFAMGSQGKGQSQSLDTILTQMDRQIFAVFGMNESILYAKGTTDLLRKQGNELFVRNVMARAKEMEDGINKLIEDYLMINCPERIGDFKVKYREITKDDDNAYYTRIMDLMSKGLIDKTQALEMVKSNMNVEIPEVEKEDETELMDEGE